MATPIPDEKITEVRHSADIVEVISDAVVLKRAGKNYQGLCPFHTEKTPSFTVNPDRQMFYCFGCSAGGDVFKFVMLHQGVTFPEAVRMLAGKYGVELPVKPMSASQKRRMTERETILQINKLALTFFHKALNGGEKGSPALAYLLARGISRETCSRFQLGYAPPGWRNLIGYLSGHRVSPSLMERAGLAIPKRGGSGYYDRFRDRVIFPIHDAGRRVIGFGGRVMDDSLPKYLNSPESPVYSKRRSLYGLHLAREKSRAEQCVYIVEGYLDVIALHQFGFENSVATLGTALTAEHVRTLKGLVGKDGRIVLIYDSDEAGINAARRSIEVFDRAFVDAHILVLPSGYDPDSYLFEFGSDAFIAEAAKASTMIEFMLDSAVSRYGTSPGGKKRIVSEMRSVVAGVRDVVEKGEYIRMVAQRIGVDEKLVWQSVRHKAEKSPSQPDRRSMANNRYERQILAMIMHVPEIISLAEKLNVLEHFEDDELRAVGEELLGSLAGGGNGAAPQSEIREKKDRILASLAVADDYWSMDGCEKLIRSFVEMRRNQEEFNKIQRMILDAEAENNIELLSKLLREKNKLAISIEKRKMALIKDKSL